ncbi:MAG: hypothetical protein R3178_08405, partial [Rhodothermales bacterium]|nr:hypothetical protein [Rhodothermales bacterium]
MQTTSLRLQGGDGRLYVLRSLDKDPTKSLPPSLRQTFARDILRDQTTSINPYGAFILSELADASGVYHTLPRLVYVPRDPRLGPFIDTFADQLMMLEDRPDDDMSDIDRYGFSDNVVSASRMHREINKDNDNAVDQVAYLRARLLDMLASDWDRHRNQWRWASFEQSDGKGRLYRPIPRDRDWAFNRLNGLFPPMVRLFNPKFQDFRYRYGNLKGLNASGLEQDRRFTSELTLTDWLEQASHIKTALSDSVIDASVAAMPPAVAASIGPEVAGKLRHRRDRLEEVAERYYRILTRVVDVVGSDKHERFEVLPAGPGRTTVVVFKTDKHGEIRKELYRRDFDAAETREIRLYGLDGNDTFVAKGAGRGITVRCIGGAGSDSFVTDETIPNVVVHDTETGNSVSVGGRTDVRLSDNPWMNTYEPREYRHDAVLPQMFFGANADDGLFVGGGARFARHRFKKRPYARTHRAVANVAARTGAFNASYDGHFVGAVSGLDLELAASVAAPNNIRNFYGLGNETENTVDDREYYQARLAQVAVSGLLGYANSSGVELRAGPILSMTDVRQDEDRFVASPQPGLSETTFQDQWFAGFRTQLVIRNLDRQ